MHVGKLKRVKDAKFPQIERALTIWFGHVIARRGIVNVAMLCEKNLEFRDAFGILENDWKLSPRWL